MHPATTWDPRQYLRHADHRTRPFHDLLARVPELPGPRARIVDLGCGAGNVTAVLAERWPDAHITGLDNSPEMLAVAQRYAGPTAGEGRLDFASADIGSWAPAEQCDLIISNAALQWVPGHADAFGRWVEVLSPGGTLAFQVPGNFTFPSHTLLAELCDQPRWRDRLHACRRDPAGVLTPADYLERLVALGCAAGVWETTYLHLLQGPDPVLDWTRGTALRPVLAALADDPRAREEFLAEYRDLLRVAYPQGPHGTPFPFRRIFAVARKEAR